MCSSDCRKDLGCIWRRHEDHRHLDYRGFGVEAYPSLGGSGECHSAEVINLRIKGPGVFGEENAEWMVVLRAAALSGAGRNCRKGRRQSVSARPAVIDFKWTILTCAPI